MRYSPAISILSAAVYAFCIAFQNHITVYDCIFAVFAVFTGLTCGAPVLRRLLKFNMIIIFICLTIVLMHGDRNFALLVFIRSNLIMAVNISLFYGYTSTDFYYGMYALRLPSKFTVLLFFVVKYIEIIGNEYNKMKEALKIRGFRAGTDMFTYKTYANMTGMLLIRSMDRSVKLSQAMRLRGFSGKLYPFNFQAFMRRDALMLAVLAVQSFIIVRELI